MPIPEDLVPAPELKKLQHRLQAKSYGRDTDRQDADVLLRNYSHSISRHSHRTGTDLGGGVSGDRLTLDQFRTLVRKAGQLPAWQLDERQLLRLFRAVGGVTGRLSSADLTAFVWGSGTARAVAGIPFEADHDLHGTIEKLLSNLSRLNWDLYRCFRTWASWTCRHVLADSGVYGTVADMPQPTQQEAAPPAVRVGTVSERETSRAVLLAWRQHTLEARLFPAPRVHIRPARQPIAAPTRHSAARWRSRRATAPVQQRDGVRALARSLMGQSLWLRGDDNVACKQPAGPELLCSWWAQRNRIALQNVFLHWTERRRCMCRDRYARLVSAACVRRNRATLFNAIRCWWGATRAARWQRHTVRRSCSASPPLLR